MRKLNESDRVTSAEMENALAAYAKAFSDDEADWLHPSLMGTRQFRDLLLESVRNNTRLSVEEIEKRDFVGLVSFDKSVAVIRVV
jgi:hypothetical protein